MGLVGTGLVGSSFAYALMIRGVASDLVLVDANREKAVGEMMDFTHGLSFTRPMKITAGSYEDLAGAQVVVIAAGAGQKPGESRLDLLARNAAVFRDVVPRIVRHAPGAVLLIATNPVDILTYISLTESGLPQARVIGSGTILDTSRFRFLLGQYYGVDARSVHAYIVGEHGDSEIPLWSLANIGGVRLQEFEPLRNRAYNQADMDKLFCEVRDAAYEIIKRKGATYYAIGLGLLAIVEAIVGDHRQARDVFVDAARLSPGDERIAYQLGRAYEELGDQYPDAMNGLAVLLMSRREYARSEQIYRSLWHHGDSPPTGLINSLMNQGKTREADSLLEAGKWVQLRRTRAEVRCAIASVAECERAIDTVLAQGAPQQIVEALRVRSSLALQAGQIERSNRVWAEANAVDKARGGFWPFDIWRASGIDWHVRHRPDLVGARLDSLGEQNAPFMVAKMAVDYTGAGRTDKARSLLARFEREQLDTTASLVRTMIAEARVHIAIAERRWVDAIAGVKALDIIRDGPNPQYCSSCLALDLGIVYDSAGVADSAIVMYERYLATPQFPRLGDPDAFTRGPVYERLGILYERIGRPTEAEAYNQKFVNLWADADAELQPRVQAAKRRLELLRRARS